MCEALRCAKMEDRKIMIRGRATVSTEEYLNKVTIGGATVHNGQISLCEYDKSWPAGFGREEEKIRGALGPRALAVEHVGAGTVREADPGYPAAGRKRGQGGGLCRLARARGLHLPDPGAGLVRA